MPRSGEVCGSFVRIAVMLLGFLGVVRLVPWWLGGSIVEERFLSATYPDYPRYRTHVRARLIPWVL